MTKMYWISIHGALDGLRLAENQITNLVKTKLVWYHGFVAYSFLYIHLQESGMVYVMCLYCCATKNILKRRAYAFCRNRSFISKV
jgi:hypothetical protein